MAGHHVRRALMKLGPVEDLAQRETWALQQRWREAFAAGVHASTGTWRNGPFEWHAFTFGFSPAVAGARALALAADRPPQPVVVLSAEAQYTFGFEARWPIDLDGHDVIIAPRSMMWSLVFAHGHDGPFYIEADGVGGRLS